MGNNTYRSCLITFSYDSFVNIETLEKALIERKNNFDFTPKLYINLYNHGDYTCTINIRPWIESKKDTIVPYYKSYRDICIKITEIVSEVLRKKLSERITEIYEQQAESKIEELAQHWPLEKIKEKYYYNSDLYDFFQKCTKDYWRLCTEIQNRIKKEFDIQHYASSLTQIKILYNHIQAEHIKSYKSDEIKKLTAYIIDLSKLGFATPPDLFDYKKASVEELREILKNARAKQQEYLEHVFRVGNSIKERDIQQEEGMAAKN